MLLYYNIQLCWVHTIHTHNIPCICCSLKLYVAPYTMLGIYCMYMLLLKTTSAKAPWHQHHEWPQWAVPPTRCAAGPGCYSRWGLRPKNQWKTRRKIGETIGKPGGKPKTSGKTIGQTRFWSWFMIAKLIHPWILMVYDDLWRIYRTNGTNSSNCGVLLCGDSGTRVLKSGSFFPKLSKANVFPGPGQCRTLKPFLPDKEFESSCGLKMVEATRELIFPTLDPFLAEAKKVLASPGLWGKLGFLPGSFFSLKEKGSDLPQILS